MNLSKPDDGRAALEIIDRLRSAGFVALLAGGCVRDRLLRRTPKDFDVATDARPERVLELFPQARRVGAKFGVVLVRKFGRDVEVATFRSDGPYSDGRHPDNVRYGTDREDAQRRDFTINGLFLDPLTERVIDYVGGRADLEAKVIRTIGDPYLRFGEDHLRMLRAVRFATRLGFELEHGTLAAIQALAPRLTAISPERIWMELEQILVSPARARGWGLLLESNLRGSLCSAWPPRGEEDDRIARRLAAFGELELPVTAAFGSTLIERSVSEVFAVCRGFRLSNKATEELAWLVRSLPALRNDGGLEAADLKMLMADAGWPWLLEVLRADFVLRGEDLNLYEQLKQRAGAVPNERVAPPPLLTGDALKSLGFAEGPELGRILKAVYRAQLNESVTTQEEAIMLANRLKLGELP
jgi:poly(A) polymerase